MSGDARDFNNIETRAVINFLPPPTLQGKAPEDIYAIRMCPSVGTNYMSRSAVTCYQNLEWIVDGSVAWLVASKETGLEVNGEKSKCIFMSYKQHAR
jgi:hypothetical protein